MKKRVLLGLLGFACKVAAVPTINIGDTSAVCNTECWIPKLDGNGRVVKGSDGKTELLKTIKIWFGDGGGSGKGMMRNICFWPGHGGHITEVPKYIPYTFSSVHHWVAANNIASCYATIKGSSGTPTPAVYCLSRCGNLSNDDAVTTYLGGPINSWLNQGCGSPGRSSSAKNIKYCNNGGLGICKNADGVTRCKKLRLKNGCKLPGKNCDCDGGGNIYSESCTINFGKETLHCACDGTGGWPLYP